MPEHHKTRYTRLRAERYFGWLKTLPPNNRSLVTLAALLNDAGDGVSVRTLERYSSDYSWQDRLNAHDAQTLHTHHAAHRSTDTHAPEPNPDHTTKTDPHTNPLTSDLGELEALYAHAAHIARATDPDTNTITRADLEAAHAARTKTRAHRQR